MTDRASVAILQECIDLQRKKGEDYNGQTTSVQQADYYPSGVKTIHEIMHAKMLRARSVMEQMEQGGKQNFESLEDTYKDLINYASFAVAYLRGQVPGQAPDRDMFNKPKLQKAAELGDYADMVPPAAFGDYLWDPMTTFLAEADATRDVPVKASALELFLAGGGTTPREPVDDAEEARQIILKNIGES